MATTHGAPIGDSNRLTRGRAGSEPGIETAGPRLTLPTLAPILYGGGADRTRSRASKISSTYWHVRCYQHTHWHARESQMLREGAAPLRETRALLPSLLLASVCARAGARMPPRFALRFRTHAFGFQAHLASLLRVSARGSGTREASGARLMQALSAPHERHLRKRRTAKHRLVAQA